MKVLNIKIKYLDRRRYISPENFSESLFIRKYVVKLKYQDQINKTYQIRRDIEIYKRNGTSTFVSIPKNLNNQIKYI